MRDLEHGRARGAPFALILGASLAVAQPSAAQERKETSARPAPPANALRGYPQRTQQDRVMLDTRAGRTVPFPDLVDNAVRAVGGGEYLGAENEPGSYIYCIKVMRPDSSVAWVDLDGRSGRVVRVRD
jgi:uncharacterized membrane protein YkoI